MCAAVGRTAAATYARKAVASTEARSADGQACRHRRAHTEPETHTGTGMHGRMYSVDAAGARPGIQSAGPCAASTAAAPARTKFPV